MAGRNKQVTEDAQQYLESIPCICHNLREVSLDWRIVIPKIPTVTYNPNGPGDKGLYLNSEA